MTRRPADARLLLVPLDPDDPRPLYRQVYDGIRGAILDGRLCPGARLPSTRTLAKELGVSRNTVLFAFEQLVAEGYLRARVGGGSHVSPDLPTPASRPARPHAPAAPATNGHARGTAEAPPPASPRLPGPLASRLEDLTPWTSVLAEPVRPFRLGIPELDSFPARIWSKLTSRVVRGAPRELWSYGAALGHEPLREALVDYLRASRGVRCEPDQILVCSGSQQALHLAARVLLAPDDPVWMEEPGYTGARCALALAGARLVPVPVDGEGLDPAAAPHGEDPRLVYVTPSHQFPTGACLPLRRRLELLQLAERAGAWILEDDYDSEFRFQGSPIPSLQGLDENGRVIYVGTFSKTLAPSLRIGFLVLPQDLVEPFVTLRSITDQHPPEPDQAVLAAFLREGHFATHVARMRRLYAERRAILIEELTTRLGNRVEVRGTGAGLHLLLLLPEGVSGNRVHALALDRGVRVTPLSHFCLEPPEREGLVLGYAAYGEEELRGAAARLAEVIDRLTPKVEAPPVLPPRPRIPPRRSSLF